MGDYVQNMFVEFSNKLVIIPSGPIETSHS